MRKAHTYTYRPVSLSLSELKTRWQDWWRKKLGNSAQWIALTWRMLRALHRGGRWPPLHGSCPPSACSPFLSSKALCALGTLAFTHISQPCCVPLHIRAFAYAVPSVWNALPIKSQYQYHFLREGLPEPQTLPGCPVGCFSKYPVCCSPWSPPGDLCSDLSDLCLPHENKSSRRAEAVSFTTAGCVPSNTELST